MSARHSMIQLNPINLRFFDFNHFANYGVCLSE